MNRKIKFSILLILCVALTGTMLLFGMNTLKAEATEREITASGTSGSISWTFYSDGELVISGEGYTGTAWKQSVDPTSVIQITIKEGITHISQSAFADYTNLTSLTIPNSITGIENYAFYNCNSLTEITIPVSLKSFSQYAFTNCDNIENVYYIGDLSDWFSINFYSSESNPLKCAENLYINNTLVTDLIIPDKIVAIKKFAFYNYKKLTNVTIPNSVTSIGEYAFYGCTGLTEITIPNSVTEIGNSIFEGCTGLKSAVLPGNTINMGYRVFSGCTTLTDVTIPYGVKNINISAFSGCTSLLDISLPNSITHVERSAFENCSSLESITIPDSVTSIGASAFQNCSKLTKITLHNNLKYIGVYAFEGTDFYNDASNWDNGFLYLKNNLIDVDDSKITSECRLYSKTRLIAASTFSNCKTIECIIIPEGVEYINDKAFYYCKKLQTISFPKSLKEIGAYAFYYCNELKNVIINEGLVKIENLAFASTPALTEIHIPQTVTSLASDAFKSSGITDIHYGDTKAEWKRLANGSTFNDATVHYTLRSDDETVIIHHTDSNFDYEAGNVHLVVTDLGKASSSYEQNGFYNRLMADPIQVLDIKLVDGDGNDIQPLSDETITVKIKASEEFMNLMKSGLSAVSEYDIEAEKIDFSDDCFIFESNGETVSVPADESFLKKFKIIHWFSDAVEPTDHESFTHDELSVENGYIVLETNHFSEYAVCTELIEFELGEIELANGESASVSVTVSNGTEITYTSSDESVVTVDENGVITAVGPGTATITVTVNGTNISDTCEVTVPARDYTIKWIVDGVETEQTVTEQTAITRPENPEKEGYTFIGWTPEVPDTMPAQNLEFNAVWQVNQYTITFDTAGGSAVAPITLAYGSAVTAPESPALDGYIFKGWTPTIPETMPAYDMTLTAVYEKVFVSEINIISLPNKTQYTYKVDNLDLSGIAIHVVYSDGSKEVITDTDAITAYGFSADSTGTKTVTVEYGGCTATYDIIVSYVWWQWIIRILLLGFIWY